MNIKETWIEALKSGQYEQGKNKLRSKNNKFCCLGVLCDLVKKENWIKQHEDGDDFHTYSWSSVESDEFPTSYFRVTSKNTNYLPGSLEDTERTMRLLAEMNDHDSSFDEIASWIEENVVEVKENGKE